LFLTPTTFICRLALGCSAFVRCLPLLSLGCSAFVRLLLLSVATIITTTTDLRTSLSFQEMQLLLMYA
jgi:hypothetical protein